MIVDRAGEVLAKLNEYADNIEEVEKELEAKLELEMVKLQL